MSHRLTPRELEVVRLVAQARSNKEVGSALQLSEFTVRNHLQSVYQKLDLHGRIALTLYAVRSGLVEVQS